MKKIVIVLLISLMSCSRENTNNIITIDANENYPELDLKLSDIADISYVPLKLGKDTIFLSPGVNRSFFATRDKFYLQDGNLNDPKIVVYDYDGNPLYTIGRKGRGPGEFMAPFGYVVDTSRNEVYINSVMQDGLIVYDTDGNFKRSANFAERLRIRNMDLINGRMLIGYKPDAQYTVPTWLSRGGSIRKSGKALTLIDLDSLSIIDFPDVSFKRIYNGDQTWAGVPKSIVNSGDGFYFFSICSDTTYHISNSLEITPRFVDVSKYPNKGEIGIYPAIETDRYVFLCSHPTSYKNMRPLDKKQLKLLAYDKIKKKLFDLNGEIAKRNLDGSTYKRFTEVLDYSFFYIGKCLNQDYLVRALSYRTLSENYANLPDTLKKITDSMTENDNPVLQIVKFY